MKKTGYAYLFILESFGTWKSVRGCSSIPSALQCLQYSGAWFLEKINNIGLIERVVLYLAMCARSELVLPVKKHDTCLTEMTSLHAISVSEIKSDEMRVLTDRPCTNGHPESFLYLVANILCHDGK